jgi:hypothetical protein
MNFKINEETLIKFLKKVSGEIKIDTAQIKPLIKDEVLYILQKFPQGMSKNDVLKHLEEVFGSQNFQNGKYEGGRELILKTIYELFSEENFDNYEYKGG